jgi:hypothetical protein
MMANLCKSLASLVFLVGFCVPVAALPEGGKIIVSVNPKNWSQELARYCQPDGTWQSGLRLQLAPGDYFLQARSCVDSTCGNCEEPAKLVPATLGLLITGQDISLVGSGQQPDEVVIHTGAGYGLFFRDCQDCQLRNLTVTDGVRDPNPDATCGAIVVKRSRVTIADCLIRDNLGDSTVVATTVTGLMGIVGREDSYLTIVGNRIIGNSWDGIALYRGAEAKIIDNVIDGVDKATGSNLGGGRGVGIGVTWDARAEIRLNLVTRYWKGIGIFVDAEATVERNVVQDMVTWGIAYWDAGRGRPVGRISENLIYETGACGISIARETAGEPAPGFCRGNLIVKTGQNPKYDDPDYYCQQCPVAVHAKPPPFLITENLLFDNRRAGCAGEEQDLTAEVFRHQANPLLEILAAQPAMHQASCWEALPVPGTGSLYR